MRDGRMKRVTAIVAALTLLAGCVSVGRPPQTPMAERIDVAATTARMRQMMLPEANQDYLRGVADGLHAAAEMVRAAQSETK